MLPQKHRIKWLLNIFSHCGVNACTLQYELTHAVA